jgi:hypothetical protein
MMNIIVLPFWLAQRKREYGFSRKLRRREKVFLTDMSLLSQLLEVIGFMGSLYMQ